MSEEMTKSKALELIRNEWQSLEETLARLSKGQMTQPGVEGDWSVKDILAHITDWEERMVRWIEEALCGQEPEMPAPGLTWDDLDLLNEQTYQANRGRELADVLTGFRRSYQQSLKAVEGLADEVLTDPQRFEWWDGDPMWRLVAVNTWEHYEEHNETIRNWLKGVSTSGPAG